MTADVKRLRKAVIFLFIGILLELLSFALPTPFWISAFMFAGIPCLAFGMFLYVLTVWRGLKKKDAL
ncbi:MAG TPA: hypothetical protein PK095_04830 [Myxococcota bacterium]|nr:hypothetical protein [Myxococcota bacterium]